MAHKFALFKAPYHSWMFCSLDFKHSMFSLTKWLSSSTLVLHLTHLSVRLSSELLTWFSECFILSFISFLLIFNDSISLLNFILISWIILIITLYNIIYYIQLHFEVLWCLFTSSLSSFIFIIIILKSLSCLLSKFLFSGNITMEVLIFGKDVLSSLYSCCFCFCDGT